MDHYHIWCDLKPGTADVDFCTKVDAYLGNLAERELVRGHRITRRKLGLGPAGLGEFHIVVEVDDLAQLERAFQSVATRAGEVEALHAAVNWGATNLTFALYRDFPDAVRELGQEKF